MYNCEGCLYNTANKSNYNRHLNTLKHKNNELIFKKNELKLKINKKITSQPFICIFCLKQFSYKTGMYRHRKFNCKLRKN